MSQQYRPAPGATRRTGRILLGLWAALTVALLGYVLLFGHNQPWADEWEFVPTLTGHEPSDAFFFQPHNEHRLPLPRAIYLGLWEFTHDFRAGMVLQVLLLSGMALRGMQLTALLRGRSHWADAFFPLALLHVGHCENLLMGYQLCFVLASALIFGVLELAVRLTTDNAPRTALLGAFAAFALTLCGGFGIILAGPILAWVALVSVHAGSRQRFNTVMALACALSSIAYIGYYLATYERPEQHPPFDSKHWAASLRVAGQFLAISLGIGVGPVWFVLLPMIIFALGFAVREGLRSDHRLRAAGLAAVAVGVILLSLAIGAGRGGFGSQMGLWPRYSVLAWPLLAAIDFAAPNSRWLRPALMISAAIALPFNTGFGLNYGVNHDRWLGDIERQLRRGKSADEIVERSLDGTGQEARALRGIPMLRDAKLGPFAHWENPR